MFFVKPAIFERGFTRPKYKLIQNSGQQMLLTISREKI
ncbi:hypothetical protein CSC17_0413 [Klebsiella oxytoca]|nr:hypothetical protein CSC17_0413 [Klebsiella oxytoca]